MSISNTQLGCYLWYLHTKILFRMVEAEAVFPLRNSVTFAAYHNHDHSFFGHISALCPASNKWPCLLFQVDLLGMLNSAFLCWISYYTCVFYQDLVGWKNWVYWNTIWKGYWLIIPWNTVECFSSCKFMQMFLHWRWNYYNKGSSMYIEEAELFGFNYPIS